MQGSSRGAFADAEAALHASLDGGADASALADDLFAVSSALDGSVTLRRALTDPSREGEAKQGLVHRLFDGKVSSVAAHILATAVGGRWSSEGDLGDAIESLAVQSELTAADGANRLDRVEEELFRFERLVAATPELRDVLTNRLGNADGKGAVVTELLEGKAAPETIKLAVRAVSAPRGLRLDRTIENYLSEAATARGRRTAIVTTAVPMSERQQARLATALAAIYHKPIQLQLVVDPQVMGGVHVQVGHEIIDGSIIRAVDDARRGLTG